VKKILIEGEIGVKRGEVSQPEGKRPITGKKLGRSTVRRTTY